MENRDKLFREAISMIIAITPQKESILYHNIYSLKLSDNYVFNSKNDIVGLANFLNNCE